MKKKYNLPILFFIAALATSAFAGVSVSAPANNSAVNSVVQFIATATTSCAKGVSAMGIYTAPYQLAYVVNGASLNHSLSLSAGTYNTVVQEWDNCGGATSTPIRITVGSGGSQTGVYVSAPANNSTVSSTVQFVATATTSCSKGVAAMAVYTAPGVLAYVVNGATLNTSLTLNPGTYNTVVQDWDNCGGYAKALITITVGSGGGTPGGGNTFVNLHQKGGWTGYALLPLSYNICSSCSPNGPQATWSRWAGVSSPSLSGNSAQHNIGGQTQFADILWNNHLIGDFSSQGLPDTNHSLVPSLHNFVYDVWFYSSKLPASQALEFDINQFVNGQSFIWGHECRVAGGQQWDIWDNQSQHWHPTGIPCKPVNNAWNHVTIQVQRTSNNQLVFQSITLNGQKWTLNYYENPTSTNWYGITVNYQQDGNASQTPYTVWLDKFNFTYW